MNQNGLGFGINIARRLLHKLGGQLLIENNANLDNGLFHGAHVTLEFPYAKRSLEESKDLDLDDIGVPAFGG